jgi:hypothetical protein
LTVSFFYLFIVTVDLDTWKHKFNSREGFFFHGKDISDITVTVIRDNAIIFKIILASRKNRAIENTVLYLVTEMHSCHKKEV